MISFVDEQREVVEAVKQPEAVVAKSVKPKKMRRPRRQSGRMGRSARRRAELILIGEQFRDWEESLFDWYTAEMEEEDWYAAYGESSEEEKQVAADEEAFLDWLRADQNLKTFRRNSEMEEDWGMDDSPSYYDEGDLGNLDRELQGRRR